MPSSEIIPIKVEEKILLHLLRHDPSRIDNFNAPMELAQEGIAVSIGINRTHIPRSMKRLIKRGLIQEISRHVPGARRKRKVYHLTPKGVDVSKKVFSRVLDSRVLVKEEGKLLVERRLGDIYEELSENMDILQLINSLSAVALFDPARIKAVLDEVERKTDYLVYPENVTLNKHFYGRKKELYIARQHLHDDSTSVMAIIGMAGMGKTSFAMQILNEMKGETHIFHHQFREFDTLRKMGKEFAHFLYVAGCTALIDYLKSTIALDLDAALNITLEELKNINLLIVLDDYQKCSSRISLFFREALRKLYAYPNIKFIIISRERPQCYERSEVVVQNKVFELELKGLTKEDSRLLLGLGPHEDQLLQAVFRITEGHPLSLELIGSQKEKDDLLHGMKDVRRFIHEEIFSNLDGEEKKVLEFASFFRRPIPSAFLLVDENISFDNIDSLVEKYLLVEGRKGYELHDLVREYLIPRVNPATLKRYHNWAASKYLEREDPMDWLEAAYHLINAEEFNQALEAVIEKGTDIMEQHHFEEFLNILEVLEEKGLSDEDMAEVLHFKGNIYIYWLMFPQAEDCFKKEMDIWRGIANPDRLEEAKEGFKRAEEHALD